MSLIPGAAFSYLTVGERNGLQEAFIEAGVTYDALLRDKLLDGVNRLFIANFLPVAPFSPTDQLASDLRRMNQYARLADGTIPLLGWLENAAYHFRLLPQGKRFEAALARVNGQGAATVAMAPEEAPPTDFEEIITDGVDDLLDVAFLTVGARRLPSVAKVHVPAFRNGQQILLSDGTPHIGAGTGWLIGSDLLLTNYHVIRNRHPLDPDPDPADVERQALEASVQFFFDRAEDAGSTVKVKELLAFGKPKTEDFALLRLAQAPGVTCLPVRNERVTTPLEEQTPKGKFVRAFVVNIIQHPGGGPKRVALRNNRVFSAEYPTLHYYTDTLSGSSGSPVFDDNWHVIALHRAYTAEQTLVNGRPQGYLNVGVQMHAILAKLTELSQNNGALKTALEQIAADQAQVLGAG